MFIKNRMLTSIEGSKDARFNNIVRMACEYYLSQLIPSQLRRHIVIDIEFKKKLEEGADGYCEVEECNARKKPREFLIQIRKDRSKKYMLMTLAHELVHLKQYALGELDEKMSVWKGRRISSSQDYWDSPWEKEARELEIVLCDLFCEEYNLNYEDLAPQNSN